MNQVNWDKSFNLLTRFQSKNAHAWTHSHNCVMMCTTTHFCTIIPRKINSLPIPAHRIVSLYLLSGLLNCHYETSLLKIEINLIRRLTITWRKLINKPKPLGILVKEIVKDIRANIWSHLTTWVFELRGNLI